MKNKTLKICSFNIRNGYDVGYDYSVIAKDITDLGIDICGLQEVDFVTERNKKQDTMKLISEFSGYKYYEYCKSIDYMGGEYGTAILSKHPIIAFERRLLSSGGNEQRSIGHATVNRDGIIIDFFNTHFDFKSADIRKEQFAEVKKMIDKCENVILTGDFNTEDFTEFECLGMKLTNNKTTDIKSFAYKEAIDNIVFSDNYEIVSYGVDDKAHSDHRMIWAELAIK